MALKHRIDYNKNPPNVAMEPTEAELDLEIYESQIRKEARIEMAAEILRDHNPGPSLSEWLESIADSSSLNIHF